MEDKLLLLFDSEKFKYNSDGSINNNKIKKAKFYEISAKYVYDKEFLKKVSNTTLFKNYLNNNTKIEQIDYRIIASAQTFLSLWNGIDITLGCIFKYNNKKCFHLDENKNDTFFMKCIINLHYYLGNFIILYGRIIMGLEFTKSINLNLKQDSVELQKSIKSLNKKSFYVDQLIIKRNNFWLPKIKNTINKNNNMNTKSLIVVGAGHIDDLITKIKIDHNVEVYNYETHQFENFNVPL
jgi:hypothetical protein